MNKIYMTKRGHDGKTVVCSEKTRARGKVKSLVLAVAAVGTLVSTQASAALTTGESGAYATVIKDATISGSGGDGAVGTVTIGSDLQYVDAYGRQAKTEATAPLSIAIGLGATAKKVDGTPADSTNPTDPNFEQPLASVAIGASATANGYTSTAIGYRSSAIDRSSSAFGVQANAENFMATAIGAGSTASGFTTTAVGSNTEAVGRNSVAVGVARHSNGVVASGEQGILLGSADIEGLSVEQLQGAQYADGANPWSSFQGVDLSNPAQTTGESRASIVSGKNALGLGVAVKATGERSIAEGYYAKASSLDAIAIGSKSQALGINSISLGHNALANGGKSIAIGSSNDNDRGTTLANGTYSVAIGPSAQATGRGGIVIGENASANGTYRNLDTKEVFTGGSMGHNTVVIGREAQTFYDHDTVVGALAAVKKSPHASAGRTEALWDKQPATIMGFKATSSGEGGDTLIGAHASNDHRQTFPIGQSTAFGSRAFVYGDQGTALGADTSAVGNSSIAIGNDDFVLAKAKLTQSIPEITELSIDLKAVENLGDVAFANGVPDSMMKAAGEPTALGTSGLNWNVRTAALGDASIAMGSSTQTGGDASIAMGFNALTRGSSSIAMGSLARANGTNAIAQGTATSAHAFDSIAIGRYATAGAAGDEIATANATAIGSKSKAAAIDSIAVGAEAIVSGDQSIAIGKTSNVTGAQSIAVGVGHVVKANNAGAFGDPSYLDADADGSYAIGNNNTITSANTFVLGSGIGRSSTDLAAESGEGTVANSVYLGNESEVTRGVGLVDGNGVGSLKTWDKDQQSGATATTAGAGGTVSTAKVGGITYGTASIGGQAFAGATSDGAVSVGSSGAERRIQNVAAGEISKTSTDAINGSQLYAVAHQAAKPITFKANSNKDTLNATMNFASDNGLERILGDEIVIKGASTNRDLSRNSDAATAGTYSARNVQTVVDDQGVQIQIATNPIFDSVQFGSNSGPKITNDGTDIKVGSSTSSPVKITNVANGTNPNDAVNLSQLNATKVSVVAGNNTHVTANPMADGSTTYTVDAEKTTISKAATSPITVTEGAKSATGVTNYEVGISIDESTLEVVDGKLKSKVVDTDTNTDTSAHVKAADGSLVTVTKAGATRADGITQITDYTVGITKGEFSPVSSTGALTAPTTDGVATVSDVVTAVNSGFWTANVGGAKLADVKFGDTLSFVDGNGTKAVIKNGGIAYDINVKSSDNSIITKPNTDGSVDLTVNSSMIPSTVVDAGKGITVTPVTEGNKTTYTVAVDDTIADKQYVADEIAKIPVVTDTNTDKSVRVAGSDLVTVTNTTGAADGITTMTDYTISLSDKVATKDFVADEIAKIPTVVDTNTISEVAQGDGITVNAVTEGDKTTYTVALDDATKAQLAKEESVVAKAGETNIVVTQPRTNGTGGNEYEVSLAKDLTGIDSIGKDGSKFTFNGDSISAGNVNITDVKSPVNATDAANKQYVDDAIAAIPVVVDTNTDKSVRVKSDSNLLTVTSKAGEADGITQMTDYTISLSDKVATTDYVDGEIAKIPTVKAGDNIAVKQDIVDGKPVVVVSADKSTVSQGDGIAVTVTETPTANGAVNRDYKVSLDDATKGTLAKVEKGINTKAEDGKVTNHQLGDTISVVGDNKNITTATTNDGAISVKMADDIKVNSVSINNTAITMGGNGIHAGDMKVTGVADGAISPSSTDAVNGSQLYATNMQVAQNAQDIRNLGDQLGDMRDEYRAGIADAAAVAGLPEIHLAGKSMFAVAGSTFKGESALAVGYSRLSDNSMTKFKASGSVNTQGDVLGTVGIGWAW